MPQVSWIYKARDGKDYNVGLYHGDNSNHVVLYSQSNIIKIDFNVFDAKSYSFYLGDDLMNLDITWNVNGPLYQLSCDRDIVYPYSDEAARLPWNDIVKAVLIIAVLGNIVVVVMSYFIK
jgi:hypothetical protein